MFSKVDANQLRQNLGSIEFLHGGAESSSELGAEAAQHYAAYERYYGLNFSELDQALKSTRSTIGTFSSGTYKLVCQHFLPSIQPPRKTAFLLHGYFDHAGLYRHLIKHLLKCDIAVIIFDLPGHGLSSGATASINSFHEYSAALVECLKLAKQHQVASPWIAIGQSTGGAIFMDALLENKLENRLEQKLDKDFFLQDFILLGPLLRPRQWSRSKILFSLSRLFVASTPRKFSKNSHDAEFLEFLENKDELQSRILPRDWVHAMIDYINRFEAAPRHEQSLQVIQGRGDGTVDWEANIPKILEKFSGSNVHWVDEAGHHLVNESLDYREQVFAIIDRLLD
ncbi:MAG: alpha/beta hydrolase [SAR86 cluster bacterium]|uniref:Alpha/beta hydrolase n=1 Tax=SAR86 cluster bacterium TaxID=2030880 RepID=A0A2A4X224_9GAMM|nr:MAG: alpha/beta hydrolase [SAR86 cluster bacterium]